MSPALCLAVVAPTLTITFPTRELTLSWIHTIEKVPWAEVYEVRKGKLVLREAQIVSSGAGMDAPTDATWEGRAWRYSPHIDLQGGLALANSEFAGGYTLCWSGACEALASFVPKGQPVELTVRACRGPTVAVERR
jgi:hypothetical protein